jgi:hypothetical protein
MKIFSEEYLNELTEEAQGALRRRQHRAISTKAIKNLANAFSWQLSQAVIYARIDMLQILEMRC